MKKKTKAVKADKGTKGAKGTKSTKGARANANTKLPLTSKICGSILGEAKGAAFSIPGMTMTTLLEEAIAAHLEILRKKHNKGQPFRGKRVLAPGRR